MFSVEKRVLLSAVVLSLLTGCFKSDSSSSPDDSSILGGPSEPETFDDQTGNTKPVNGTMWCRVSDFKTSQLITRMKVADQKISTDYIRVVSGKPLTIYKTSGALDWESKAHDYQASIPNRYLVKIRKTDAEIKALAGFNDQKKIFDEIFIQNPNLPREKNEFAPTVAMSAWTRSITSGDELERNVYPCADFSKALLVDEPIRPIVELNLLLAQESTTYYKFEGAATLAKGMQLTPPIAEPKTDWAALNNTHWCAWHEVGPSQLKLYTLTIGTSKFVVNEYTETFATYPDEYSIVSNLENNATHSETYQTTVQNGMLRGKNVSEGHRYPAEDMFTLAQDVNGIRVLARIDIKRPDDTNYYFHDVYHDCNDARPKAFSPAFNSRLGTILELQAKQLQQQ